MPGWVWVNGSYSLINHTTRTWIGELTVTSGVSVNEINAQPAEINLFPNPAGETIIVEFNKAGDGRILIELTDSGGKMVRKLYSGSISKGKNSFSFHTDALNAGNYMVTIKDNKGGIVAGKKFIKN